jgi:hypothetical protein
MTGEKATVEVPAHDLHRLLLAFRIAIASGAKPGGWTHAADWDLSFERLADILDTHHAATGITPDRRTRCQRTSVYNWPDITGQPRPVHVRSPRQRHLAVPGTYRALCGFRFTAADIVGRPGAAYRACQECERERRLQDLTTEPSRLRHQPERTHAASITTDPRGPPAPSLPKSAAGSRTGHPSHEPDPRRSRDYRDQLQHRCPQLRPHADGPASRLRRVASGP